MKLRLLVSCLLLAAICLPFLVVPDVHSQIATTTSMTIAVPPVGQCSVLPLGFSAKHGQVIGGVFGADVAINLFIVSANDYNTFNKTGGCALPASAAPLFEETNVVGTHNNYATTPFPADGTYYFIFIYRNTGFAQLTSNYVTITLSFPSSISLVSVSANTMITTAVSSVATSSIASITLSSSMSTSVAISSTTSIVSQSSPSVVLVTTSILSPIVPSTESQSASGPFSFATLLLVIVGVIVVGGGVVAGFMFKGRERHTLSSYLTRIDSTYNQYAENREECRGQLERLKSDAIEMLKNGKIDEGHFLMLDEKIGQYLKDLARTGGSQRQQSDTGAGEAVGGGVAQGPTQEATFCKNCGARLASDENLCRKCGTKR